MGLGCRSLETPWRQSVGPDGAFAPHTVVVSVGETSCCRYSLRLKMIVPRSPGKFSRIDIGNMSSVMMKPVSASIELALPFPP